ncbi:MAG: hypothetical protein ACRD1Z_02620, partial [Vicinamibacteria bacterium]
MNLLWTLPLSLAIAAALTPFVRRLAWRYGALDLPTARKVNRLPMPLLGGTVIYLALFLPCIAYLALSHDAIVGDGSR